MPAPKHDVGLDFAQSLGSAMTPPETVKGGRDLPDGFPLPPSETGRIIDTNNEPQGINGAIAYDFTVNRRVFIIYRPWESCDRCNQAIANGEVVLPVEEGDYECPHTTIKAYRDVINKVLAGELVSGGEQEIIQKDGSVCVSLRWYDKKINHKRLRQLSKQNDDEKYGPG